MGEVGAEEGLGGEWIERGEERIVVLSRVDNTTVHEGSSFGALLVDGE